MPGIIVFTYLRRLGAEIFSFGTGLALVSTLPHVSGCRARRLAAVGKRTHLPCMILDLADEETDALARLLSRTIDDDRYPLAPRIQTLKAILAKIQPEPVREPLRPPKVYAPPSAAAARKRRARR